jgi:phage-related protein
MPDEVRRAFGHALWEIQNGVTPENASPFGGFSANEVMKLSERQDGDTFRCVYAAKFERRVYILHVFQKKSKSGIATPKADIERVRRRFVVAKAEYEAEFGLQKEKKP